MGSLLDYCWPFVVTRSFQGKAGGLRAREEEEEVRAQKQAESEGGEWCWL